MREAAKSTKSELQVSFNRLKGWLMRRSRSATSGGGRGTRLYARRIRVGFGFV